MLKRTKPAKGHDLDVAEILTVSIHNAHDPETRTISLVIGEGYIDPGAPLGWNRATQTSYSLSPDEAAAVLDGGSADELLKLLYKHCGERGRTMAPARMPKALPEEGGEE